MRKMDLKKLESEIRAAVEEYIDGEESYGDNMVVAIDPASGAVVLEDEDEADQTWDLYDVMDLIDMDSADPGVWKVDNDAIESVIEEYKK